MNIRKRCSPRVHGLTHPHKHPNFPGLSATKSCASALVFIFRCDLPDHYTVDSNPEKVGKDRFYLNLPQFQHCILLLHLFFPHKLAHLAPQVLTTTWSSPCATSTAVAPYCLRRRIRRIRPLRSQQGKSWAWRDGRSFRAKTRMGSFTWCLGSVNFSRSFGGSFFF